jgi:hypothetical protein
VRHGGPHPRRRHDQLDTAHEATKISLRVVISSVVEAVGAGPADIDHDGVVGILDFLALLAAWT